MTHGRPKSKLKVLALLAVLVVAGGGGVWLWQSQRAYHLATVHVGGLYRDGAKSEGQFGA